MSRRNPESFFGRTICECGCSWHWKTPTVRPICT